MNTDFFSTSQGGDSEATNELTKRLYPSCENMQLTSACEEEISPASLLENLKKLLDATPEEKNVIPMDSSIAWNQMIEEQLNDFQRISQTSLKNYLEEYKQRPALPDHLYILHGCPSEGFNPLAPETPTGGYFFRWKNKGIAINPGKNFLQFFHQKKLFVPDIDIIINTHVEPHITAEIEKINQLNGELNRTQSSSHLIQYFLHPSTYQQLFSILKPSSRQVKKVAYPLESYNDSMETIELTPDIYLHYFHLAKNNDSADFSLGLKFQLKHAPSTKTLGYLPPTPWTSSLSQYLIPCDLLITAFGKTQKQDYSKLQYDERCLGYYGTYSLLNQIKPLLSLCSEFNSSMGDVRIELMQKMRQESSHLPSTTIFPAEEGLQVDLKTLQLQCSLTKKFYDPSHIHVIKSKQPFGRLTYASAYCCL